MAPALACLSSMATRGVLADLLPVHEARTGRTVSLQAMGGVDAARMVRTGGPADVVVLAAGVMAQLQAEGHLVAGSLAPVARASMAAAIRRGVEPPAFVTEEHVKGALLAAGRVAYSTGPSGDHLLGLVSKWGLSDVLAGRLLQAPPGVPVAALLADGRADLGFQQTSELLGQPGIALVGPLPTPIGLDTVFTAGSAATCRDPAAAAMLVASLASPEGADAKRARGMDQP